MKEYGSDFHYMRISDQNGSSIRNYISNATYYASGRQPIIDIYQQCGWKNLWVPEYFCYDVLATLEKNRVNLKFYPDNPLANDNDVLRLLPFEKGDALLRVNYFGLRAARSNCDISVPVIEDHTHDLIGVWAMNSDADWCIASLRKTLPLAEGGILWSPKGMKLQIQPKLTQENEMLASHRWDAMRKKTSYLNNVITDKNEYRIAMLATEERIEKLRISMIDKESDDFINHFNVKLWYEQKKTNHEALKGICSQVGGLKILEPEDAGCNPFSLTILFDTEKQRNCYRSYLIKHSVYPAILWGIPDNKERLAKDFSKRMLSIHCDARYSLSDIMNLQSIIVGNKTEFHND